MNYKSTDKEHSGSRRDIVAMQMDGSVDLGDISMGLGRPRVESKMTESIKSSVHSSNVDDVNTEESPAFGSVAPADAGGLAGQVEKMIDEKKRAQS